MSTELEEFLAGRLAELETADWHVLDCSGMPHEDGYCCDAQRWLARDVAAKRAIVELHKISTEPEILNIDHHDKKWNTGWTERKPSGRTVYWCEMCDHDRDYGHISGPDEGCLTLRQLATAWNDHPDYRPEWKP